MSVIISAYQVAATYMKVGLHPGCGMKINARLLRPAPELNKCKCGIASGCPVYKYRPARKVSQAKASSSGSSCTPHGRYRADPRAVIALTTSRGSPFLRAARAIWPPRVRWLVRCCWRRRRAAACLCLCLSSSSIASCLLASYPHLTCCPHVNNSHSITFA